MTRTQGTRGRGARKLLVLGAMAIAAGLCGIEAHAQSLDAQYAYYLTGKCQNLGFARGANKVVLPGQAGPHLSAFCSGPIAVGGVSEASASGGGAVAETVSESGDEERALQRRRERLQKSNSGEAATPDPSDAELASFGATSIFTSLDYLHERQTTTTYESGRHSSGFGGLLGADRRFGAKVLAGLALQYAGQSGTIDSGGNFLTHTRGVRIYGSWLPVEGLFFDGAAGFDHRDLYTQRIVELQVVTFGNPRYPGTVSYNPPPLPADSTAHERNFSGEWHAGYDFSFSGLSIGPRAALTFAHSVLDPYVESGTTPMTLALNAQTRTFLRSLIGFQVAQALNLRTGALVPQLNVDWVHEYRDDQQLLSAHFAEDLRPDPVELHFLDNPPDRDWFVIRLAAVAVFRHGLNAFAAVERTAGNTYIERSRASLGVRWEL